MRNHNPMPGSRYKDSHGAVVTVQRVEHNRVTFTARAISRHVFSLWRDSLRSSWRCAVILNEPAAQKEAFNLASLLTNVNPYNLSKPDIHRRAVATNDDILEAFSGLRIGLRILINPKFFRVLRPVRARAKVSFASP